MHFHNGSFLSSNVIAETASLHMGCTIFDNFKTETDFLSPVKLISKDNAISPEVLKKAEKENCHIIRLVELKGANSSAELIFKNQGSKLTECDLIEWNNLSTPIIVKDKLKITMKPFEIKTFK